MRNLHVRETQASDLKDFKMLCWDALEVMASSQRQPQEAVDRVFELSQKCWSVFQDGILVAIFGVGHHADTPKQGIPWMLRTVHIKNVSARDYWALSKACEAWLSEGYETLVNLVWEHNFESIQWLKKLGYTMGNSVIFDHESLTKPQRFIYFYKEVQCVTS